MVPLSSDESIGEAVPGIREELLSRLEECTREASKADRDWSRLIRKHVDPDL